jgi:hypothetical protein
MTKLAWLNFLFKNSARRPKLMQLYKGKVNFNKINVSLGRYSNLESKGKVGADKINSGKVRECGPG